MIDDSEAPDAIKTATWLAKNFRRYWRILITPPVAITIALAIFGSYKVGTSIENDRIIARNDLVNTKQAQIDFLASEIGAYRDRLQGASPDQAAKRVADLEARLEAQRKRIDSVAPEFYRHLTSMQKDGLKKSYELHKSILTDKGFMLSAEAIGDAPNFAFELANFLETLQSGIIFGPATGTCDEGEHGISIAVKDLKNPIPEAVAFFEIFRDAGFSPSYNRLDGKQGDFSIFVCRQS